MMAKYISRKTWIKVDRATLHIEQDGFCAYCLDKTKKPTFDHVKPISSGGLDGRENGVMACKGCNHAKGNMSVNQFKKLIKTATIGDGLNVYLCYIRRHFNLLTRRSVRNIYRCVGIEMPKGGA